MHYDLWSVHWPMPFLSLGSLKDLQSFLSLMTLSRVLQDMWSSLILCLSSSCPTGHRWLFSKLAAIIFLPFFSPRFLFSITHICVNVKLLRLCNQRWQSWSNLKILPENKCSLAHQAVVQLQQWEWNVIWFSYLYSVSSNTILGHLIRELIVWKN